MAEVDCISKACRGCGIVKLLDEFHVSKGKLGRAAKCKMCRAQMAAEYRSRPGYREAHAERCKDWAKRVLADKRAESGWVDPKDRTTRVCRACGECKPLELFYNDKKGSQGKSTRCVPCTRAASAEWYSSNQVRASSASLKWRENNRDKVRQYTSDHWYRNKMRPEFRLRYSMRTAVARSLRSGRTTGAYRYLGYSLDSLREHLEKQFTSGMSWENYGEWHIDHIVPLSSFSIKTINDADFAAAWALSNLRPMWASDNVKKHAKRIFLI